MKSLDDRNAHSSKTGAEEATAVLRSVGSLLSNKAERAKLTTVTMPYAYGELGKAVYHEGRLRDEFTEEFDALDRFHAERKKIIAQAEARPAAASVADKAKRAAYDAASLAKSKAIDVKEFQAFARLGHAVYERHGAAAGPTALVGVIDRAVERRKQLDQHAAAAEAGSRGMWVTPRRLLLGFGVMLGLVCLWVFAGTGWTPAASDRNEGIITMEQYKKVPKGMLKFAVEDMLGTPKKRDIKTEQRNVRGSRGETFGYENVNTIVFQYGIAGDPGRTAVFVFQGRGTNPPLEDKDVVAR